MSDVQAGSVAASGGGALTVPCGFKFSGTAWGLFGQLFISYLLTFVTLGLYLPWFICRLQRWTTENINLVDSQGNKVTMRFTGTGGELFGAFIGGMILTVITFGLYGFWFAVSMIKFATDNTEGTTPDGKQVKVSFGGTGGGLFGTLFVGYVLVLVTFGLYTPWFMCKMIRWLYSHIQIRAGGDDPITLSFQGTGGEFFGVFIVGYILTVVTFSIYSFWWTVNIWKFQYENTVVTLPSGNRLAVSFTGTGGEFAGLSIVGIILMCITCGLYYFRFTVTQIQFQTDNIKIGSYSDASSSAAGVPKSLQA